MYTLQAAIAAVHSNAADLHSTDWSQIIALYDMLLQVLPSPVIELNRALAVSQRDGPAAVLALLEHLGQKGDLDEYYLFHAARADLYRQLGRTEEAKLAYQKALVLTQQAAERRFLEGRLAETSNFQ
jgi:RNA polymerase sigma-70 factor (ECF subfamily)